MTVYNDRSVNYLPRYFNSVHKNHNILLDKPPQKLVMNVIVVIGGIVAETTYPDVLSCGIEKPFWIAWDSSIVKVILDQNGRVQC